MNNPYYFTDRALQVGFNINLDSRHFNHAKSEKTKKPNFPEFEIEFRCINKILEELAIIYPRLKNQCEFEYQTVFSATFVKQEEFGVILDQIEIYKNLNNKHTLPKV